MHRRLGLVAALLVVAACSAPAPTPSPSPSPSPSASATPSAVPSPVASATDPAPAATAVATGTWTIAALLPLLRVAPESRTGYQRSLFPHWIDADGDGCDTRREVLLRDAAIAPTVSGTCTLSGGSWTSPYDGLVFTDASRLDIDHVVPLAEAWDSGASGWTTARRRAFANDLDVAYALLAVSASSNRSKGDQDPAEWLPPLASDLCAYLADWVGVKAGWGLAVDPAEQSAIAAHAECAATTVYVLVEP